MISPPGPTRGNAGLAQVAHLMCDDFNNYRERLCVSVRDFYLLITTLRVIEMKPPKYVRIVANDETKVVGVGQLPAIERGGYSE